MGSCMLVVAVLTAVYPPPVLPPAGLAAPAVASLAMIYLEAMSYNISWGPVPWVYMGEIFPTRIREGAVAVGTSTQWLFNFVFSQVTPHAVENLGWKTFVMFAVFNWALVVFVWFFVKETKGRTLEEMEACKCQLTFDHQMRVIFADESCTVFADRNPFRDSESAQGDLLTRAEQVSGEEAPSKSPENRVSPSDA